MMQQSSYHRSGDAPGLDPPNPIPSEGLAAEVRTRDEFLLTGITFGVFIAIACISFVAIVADAWISLPMQTACLLMDAQR